MDLRRHFQWKEFYFEDPIGIYQRRPNRKIRFGGRRSARLGRIIITNRPWEVMEYETLFVTARTANGHSRCLGSLVLDWLEARLRRRDLGCQELRQAHHDRLLHRLVRLVQEA